MFKLLFLIISTLLILASAHLELKVIVHQTPFQLSELQDFNNIRLIINSINKYIHPHHKNIFKIPKLPDGKHFIQVTSSVYLFPILLLTQKGSQTSYHLMNPINRKIISKLTEPILKPLEKIQYLQPQAGSFIGSFLFSGSGIMILMAVFMLFCYQKVMPKLQQAQQAPQ